MPFELDRRTRRDEDRRYVTAEEFFSELFPHLAASNGRQVAKGMAAYDARPLAVSVEGRIWTLRLSGQDAIDALEGSADDALLLELTAAQFCDWAQNQMTLNGLMVARELSYSGGSETEISIWDSLWQCLLEGWATTEPGLQFIKLDGEPLDLARSFGRADDPAEIAHFLREAGFVHLRSWLPVEDMAEICRDMDRALPSYHEGDGRSWWAGLADGARVCVRMQEFVGHSPAIARILSSDAWEHMRKILGRDDALLPTPVEGRIIEALIKPVGVVSGPSDLSFHRDCHLGRHAYVCSRMTVGVALTPTGPANGMLRVIAGSHRVALPVEIAKTNPPLPVVALATQPGDLTVHLSCTLHEATAPQLAERRVMYTEIPLMPHGGGPGIDTSVGKVRERIHVFHQEREGKI